MDLGTEKCPWLIHRGGIHSGIYGALFEVYNQEDRDLTMYPWKQNYSFNVLY